MTWIKAQLAMQAELSLPRLTLAFDLLDDCNHERVPFERLVQSRACADIHWLYREGWPTEGISLTLQTAHAGDLIAAREVEKS